MKKGITFLSIMVAVVALAIITATLVISVPNVIQSSKLRSFATELMEVQLKVQSLNGNYSEYIVNDIVVDISDLTDKSMFEGIITDNKVSLQQLNLEALGLNQTVYGNSKTSKDIYCVSSENNVVYYLEGFETPDAKYYALNSDLMNMVSSKEDLTDNVGTNIVFVPSTYVKTSDAITLTVKVPVAATGVNITTSGNVTPTVSGVTIGTNYNQYTVNTNSVKGNYTVTVKYTLNGETKTATYNVEEYLGVYGILYSDGELRINNDGKVDKYKLEAGNTVTFQSADIANSSSVPWSTYATSIKTVTFENDVVPAYVASWFNGCTNLTEVNNIEYLDTRNVTSMANMFAKCKNLKELDISTLDASSLNNMYWMFYGCTNLVDLNMTGFSVPNRVNVEEAFRSCSKLKSIDFSGISKVKSMYGAFRDCAALTELDLNHITEVRSISTTFMGCKSLVTLKVENMDVSNIKSLHYTFANCLNLEALDLSKWNIGKVTTLEYTFLNCQKLKELDLNNWNTSQVTNMHQTFMSCISLENVYISNWNTGNVTTFTAMFQGASALKEIDMTNWNVSNVTTAAGMFYGCTNLKTVKANNWGENKITNMSLMFLHCNNLESIYLTNLITSKVTDMTQAFYAANKLTYLDMSKATFDQITSYSTLFSSIMKATIIVADDTAKSWVEARLADTNNANCVVKKASEL